MAEQVKDAILLNEFDDLVLLRLIEMTVASIRSGRPMFPNVLDEPAFFRKYFRAWVEEALDERDRLAASLGNSVME